jgi:hypothetical protein
MDPDLLNLPSGNWRLLPGNGIHGNDGSDYQPGQDAGPEHMAGAFCEFLAKRGVVELGRFLLKKAHRAFILSPPRWNFTQISLDPAMRFPFFRARAK